MTYQLHKNVGVAAVVAYFHNVDCEEVAYYHSLEVALAEDHPYNLAQHHFVGLVDLAASLSTTKILN